MSIHHEIWMAMCFKSARLCSAKSILVYFCSKPRSPLLARTICQPVNGAIDLRFLTLNADVKFDSNSSIIFSSFNAKTMSSMTITGTKNQLFLFMGIQFSVLSRLSEILASKPVLYKLSPNFYQFHAPCIVPIRQDKLFLGASEFLCCLLDVSCL